MSYLCSTEPCVVEAASLIAEAALLIAEAARPIVEAAPSLGMPIWLSIQLWSAAQVLDSKHQQLIDMRINSKCQFVARHFGSRQVGVRIHQIRSANKVLPSKSCSAGVNQKSRIGLSSDSSPSGITQSHFNSRLTGFAIAPESVRTKTGSRAIYQWRALGSPHKAMSSAHKFVSMPFGLVQKC